MSRRRSATTILIVLLCTYAFFVNAQQPVISTPGMANEPFNKGLNSGKLPLPPVFRKAGTIRKGQSIQNSTVVPVVGRTLNAECKDSSFVKEFESPGRSYSFFCSAKTRDGGILIGGFGRDMLQGPPYLYMSTLTKFDSIGNHLWSKEIRSDIWESIYIESIKELSDGTIIITGWHSNSLYYVPPTNYQDVFVAKLTSTGDIIWLKTFNSLLNNNCSTNNLRNISVSEGINGDLLLAGTMWNCPLPKYLVVFKLNSSGIVQWKYAFKDPMEDSYAAGVFYDNNEVTVVNRVTNMASGGDNVIHIDFVKLNYATGALLSQKSWRSGMSHPQSYYHSFTNYVTAIKLANGNYCVYGQLVGYLSITTQNQPRFAVLEFNPVHDFVKGYTIHSSLESNSPEDKIKVNRFGQVAYALTTIESGANNKNKYIGMADNGFITNQRKKEYRDREVFYDNFEVFDDGSLVFITNTAEVGQASFSLGYSLLHSSDTGSICLGLRDDFSFTAPHTYIPYNFNWEEINPNPFIETNNQGNSTIPLTYTATPPCIQLAVCDTIKIHGNSSTCNANQELTFTCFKNKLCGSRVSWKIDPYAVTSLQTPNDTTVVIDFDKEWTGWLYAEINTSCGLLKDSMLVVIISLAQPVDLGNDIFLCTGNTAELNAQAGYHSYLWNDGSTNSTLTVSAPGKYFVTVLDACTNTYSDTVMVTAAPAAPLSLGPDLFKCNDDTLRLVVPPGFMNFTFGPQPLYNTFPLSGVPGILVFPDVDTIYHVKAEKTPGCFSFDTVHVTVRKSPPITLGGDKSFCRGDTVIIDAGNGFHQYVWSNGSIDQQIKVFTTGDYSVRGATTDGCESRDTLRIVNVWNNPALNLDDNPGICAGSSRILRPGNFESYLWHDGSTGPAFTVTGEGTYHVTVWDDHDCQNSDTVVISQVLPLPKDFLPASAELCIYEPLDIKSLRQFPEYRWNNNSTSSSIRVSQPGIYWLEATDANNCTNRDSILVTSKECLTGFHIPTAFTPDNNGRNDIFKPFIGGIVQKYQFTIYNRWGQIIFSTTDIYKGWDGKFGGVPQDSNIFIWTCTYQLQGDKIKFEKGTLTLIR
jgi:gliding motility-associated-like protein